MSAKPDAVSSQVAARSTGHRVEDLSQRSETEKVYANPDGTWTAETATGPERVQDGKGGWHDIDTTLVAEGGALRPRYAAVDLSLSEGGNDPFVSVTRLGHLIQWRWPGRLPQPVVSGSTATYRDVIPGEDLVVTATPTGFTHSLILRQRPTRPVSLTIPVTVTGNGKLVKRAEGGVAVESSSGKPLVEAPQPLMWDASKDAGGDPGKISPVAVSTGKDNAGRPTMTLTPDSKFLSDPATTYPVTVDPSFTAWVSGDVWVENPNYTSGQVSSDELRVGTYDGGGHVARAFMHFNTTTWNGKDILSAKLVLRNYYSGSCTGAIIRASRITSSWDGNTLTWGNQPNGGSAYTADYTPAHGYNSTCDSADATWDITGMVQDWASGNFTNNGIKLKAPDETSIYTWRRYRSANYSTSSVHPHINVTYNSYPSASSLAVSPGNTGYARSSGPTVSAKVSDPDGGSVTANFSVVAGTTTVWSGSKSVAAGSQASLTLPSGKLSNGTSYTLKVSASDGSLSSKTTPTLAFKVDTSPPSTTVTCSGYPSSGTWLDSQPASNDCALTGASDTTSFQVTEDSGTPFTVKADSSGVGSVSWNPSSGAHTLKATATDQAGNVGSAGSFQFGVGSAGMTAPADNASSAAGFPITMTGPPNATGASLQWRIQGSTSGWSPATQVTVGGSNWTGSAPTADGVASPGSLVWTPTGEPLASAPTGKLAAPALLEIRGCFTYASGPDSCTPVKPLQLDDGFGGGYAITHLGPALVALTTGGTSYTAVDASTGEAGIGRSWTSSNVTSHDGASAFGVGWSSDALTPGESESTVIDRHNQADKSFVINFSTGGDETFTWSTTNPSDGVQTYLPTDPNDDTSKLMYTPLASGAATLDLIQNDDTSAKIHTTWHYDTSTNDWVLDTATDPGVDTATSVNGSGKVTWISQVPTGTSSTCTAATQDPGCRGLAITYDGDHVAAITLKKSGAADKVVATYTYNTDNTLKQECSADPGTGGGPLCTSYTYNLPADGPAQLASITPPGQATWSFDYDSSGRVIDAQRANPVGSGTTKWAIDYGEAITDPALPDMSAASRAQWGQTDAPSTVYAIYSPQADGTTPVGDPTKASLIYAGVDGSITNTATHRPGGWALETTWKNFDGNVTQTLDETGYLRVEAAAAADRPGVAQAASSFTVYDKGGRSHRVLDEFGPSHSTALKDGTTGQYRSHTHYVYADQDASLGGPNPDPTSADDLVVETDTSAADPSMVGSDFDKSVTRYAYNPIVSTDGNGWTLGIPTKTQTQVDANTWSVTTTRYDSSGNRIESRQPGGAADSTGAGADAHSTYFEYYTSDNADTDCKSADWAGLLCKSGPAAQPSGNPMPTRWNKGYDDMGQVTDVLETSGTTSTTTRETVTTYDALGRVKKTVKSIVGGAAQDDNTALVTNVTYDAEGNPATVDNGTASLTTHYDSWGRVTDYTDAFGTHSTTSYTPAGQVATFNDSAGTYTYSYDTNGNLSSVDTGGAGMFTYTWTPEGKIDSITLPNGMVQSRTYDELGTPTGISYSQGGTTIVAVDATLDVGGRTLSQVSTESHQDFSYDGLGRLTSVQDSRASGCTTRNYTFDASSNRSSSAVFGPDPNTGDCQTTTPGTSLTSSYDAAGRATNTGYTYDNLGRTRTIPAGETQLGVQAAANGLSGVQDMSATYHVDDMISSLTQTAPDDSGTLQSTTTNYGLDPAERIDTVTTAVGGSETQRLRYRFAGNSDAPAVVDSSLDGGASWTPTRYVSLPGMGMVAAVSGGTAELMLENLHGDVIATCAATAGTTVLDSYNESDEYGNPLDGANSGQRYGWLGTYQRSNDALAGFTLMGARLYNAVSGSFASMDPVMDGGATRYTYPNDPINDADLDGQMWWSHYWHWDRVDLYLHFSRSQTTWMYYHEWRIGAVAGLINAAVAGIGLGTGVAWPVAALVDLIIDYYVAWLLDTVSYAHDHGRCLRIRFTVYYYGRDSFGFSSTGC